jgi:hypothetical protein
MSRERGSLTGPRFWRRPPEFEYVGHGTIPTAAATKGTWPNERHRPFGEKNFN